MEQQRKQDTNIGSGDGKAPILASEKPSTAAKLKPSRPRTSIEQGSTKPVSLTETLSLLQTSCFDLQSMGCEVSILARGKRLYLLVSVPSDTGTLEIKDGHIAINGKPVSDL
jgi:hypothetical protein